MRLRRDCRMDRRSKKRGDDSASGVIDMPEDARAAIEARNGLQQYDEMMRIIEEAVRGTASFSLTPELGKRLNGIAIVDVHKCPGEHRSDEIEILGSAHEPPPKDAVDGLMQDMCDYVNSRWQT